MITGSIAAAWHLGKTRTREMLDSAGDIDLTLTTAAAQLPANIAAGFLVNHYHPGREQGNLLLQMIDPDNRIQVDIFTPRSQSVVQRSVPALIGTAKWRLISAEDLAARLLAIVSILSHRL